MEQKERIERLAKHLWETSKIKTHGAFITWERMEETIGRADKTKKYWRLKAEAALLAMDGGGGGERQRLVKGLAPMQMRRLQAAQADLPDQRCLA